MALAYNIGEATIEGLAYVGSLARLTGGAARSIFVDPFRGRKFRLSRAVHQAMSVGVEAVPIVSLISFFVGTILALQGAYQLRKLGAMQLVAAAVAIVITRELGPLMTAIMVIGRSGSAFAAEIGTMKVNEEIDAMQTMGLNVDDVLILPRVTGLVIALPLLTLYADVMAMIGGAVMCYFQLGITVPVFLRQLHDAIDLNTFLVGMIKAPVFAYVIGMVGCFEGLNVERNAASVGKLTTRSVVESVFLVIVLDAGFSIMFSILGI